MGSQPNSGLLGVRFFFFKPPFQLFFPNLHMWSKRFNFREKMKPFTVVVGSPRSGERAGEVEEDGEEEEKPRRGPSEDGHVQAVQSTGKLDVLLD